MSPRNMTTSKWDNHKSGLQGFISILQNKKRNKDLDGICTLFQEGTQNWLLPYGYCCPPSLLVNCAVRSPQLHEVELV